MVFGLKKKNVVFVVIDVLNSIPLSFTRKIAIMPKTKYMILYLIYLIRYEFD